MAENPNASSPVQARKATQATGATFQIKNTKLWVPAVSLSMNDNIQCF